MEPSIFTKIIRGDIPCYKIYEDDATLAFLDIFPSQSGHTLVVPKQQVDRFEDLPADDYRRLMETVKKVAKRLREVYPDKRVTLKVEGFDVAHAHIHLIPCATAEEFWQKPALQAEPDHVALKAIADKLAFS